MKITLDFNEFVRVTNILKLQWYYEETVDSFHIFALLDAHVLDTRIKYTEIDKGSGNPEFARSFFRSHYLATAIKPIETDSTIPKPSTLPTTLTETKQIITEKEPDKRIDELDKKLENISSNLKNIDTRLSEMIQTKVEVKPPKAKATLTTTGGPGTIGTALIPVHVASQLGVRRCLDCGTFVLKGVNKCPKCGGTNIGTGAPKPEVVEMKPEQFAAAMMGMSQKSTEPELQKFIGWEYIQSLPETLEFIENYNFGEITDITTEQREQIKVAIKNGIASGVSIETIRDVIVGIVNDVDKANVITRTEVRRAVTEGALLKYEKEGVRKVRFVAFPLSCSECLALNGEEMSMEEARKLIPVHPNCKCTYQAMAGD